MAIARFRLAANNGQHQRRSQMVPVGIEQRCLSILRETIKVCRGHGDDFRSNKDRVDRKPNPVFTQ